jgi:aubergine-like protein
VSKRIHTHFFLPVGDRYVNPEPGTVVDSVVTNPDLYDFFLVPQNARQGTVNR